MNLITHTHTSHQKTITSAVDLPKCVLSTEMARFIHLSTPLFPGWPSASWEGHQSWWGATRCCLDGELQSLAWRWTIIYFFRFFSDSWHLQSNTDIYHGSLEAIVCYDYPSYSGHLHDVGWTHGGLDRGCGPNTEKILPLKTAFQHVWYLICLFFLLSVSLSLSLVFFNMMHTLQNILCNHLIFQKTKSLFTGEGVILVSKCLHYAYTLKNKSA